MANANDAHPEDAFIENNDGLVNLTNDINMRGGILRSRLRLRDDDDDETQQHHQPVFGDNNSNLAFSSESNRGLYRNTGGGRPNDMSAPPLTAFRTSDRSMPPRQHSVGATGRRLTTTGGGDALNNKLAMLDADINARRAKLASGQQHGFPLVLAGVAANESCSSQLRELHQARSTLSTIREKHRKVSVKQFLVEEYCKLSQHNLEQLKLQLSSLQAVGTTVIAKLVTDQKQRDASIVEQIGESRSRLEQSVLQSDKQFAAVQQMISNVENDSANVQAAIDTTQQELHANTETSIHLSTALEEADQKWHAAQLLLAEHEKTEQKLAAELHTYENYDSCQIVRECDHTLVIEQLETVRVEHEKACNATHAVTVEQAEISSKLDEAREVTLNLRVAGREVSTQDEMQHMHLAEKLNVLTNRIEHERAMLAMYEKNFQDHVQWEEKRRQMCEKAQQTRKDLMELRQAEQVRIHEQQRKEQLDEANEMSRRNLSAGVTPKPPASAMSPKAARHAGPSSASSSSPSKTTVSPSPVAAPAASLAQSPSQLQQISSTAPADLAAVKISPEKTNNKGAGSGIKASPPGKLRPSESFKRPNSPSKRETSPVSRKRRSFREQPSSSSNNNNSMMPPPPPPQRNITPPISNRKNAASAAVAVRVVSQATNCSSLTDLYSLPDIDMQVVNTTKPTGQMLKNNSIPSAVLTVAAAAVNNNSSTARNGAVVGKNVAAAAVRVSEAKTKCADEQSIVSQFSLSKIL